MIDIIKRTLTSVAIPCVLEPPGLSSNDGKRPDGMTTIPWQRGKPLTWDVTVVDSLAPSRRLQSGSAATDAEQRKSQKYNQLVGRGYLFQPIALDVQGNYGSATAAFFDTLTKKLSEHSNESRSIAFFHQRISTTLQQYNHSCVIGTAREEHRVLDEIFVL